MSRLCLRTPSSPVVLAPLECSLSSCIEFLLECFAVSTVRPPSKHAGSKRIVKKIPKQVPAIVCLQRWASIRMSWKRRLTRQECLRRSIRLIYVFASGCMLHLATVHWFQAQGSHHGDGSRVCILYVGTVLLFQGGGGSCHPSHGPGESPWFLECMLYVGAVHSFQAQGSHHGSRVYLQAMYI